MVGTPTCSSSRGPTKEWMVSNYTQCTYHFIPHYETMTQFLCRRMSVSNTEEIQLITAERCDNLQKNFCCHGETCHVKSYSYIQWYFHFVNIIGENSHTPKIPMEVKISKLHLYIEKFQAMWSSNGHIQVTEGRPKTVMACLLDTKMDFWISFVIPRKSQTVLVFF